MAELGAMLLENWVGLLFGLLSMFLAFSLKRVYKIVEEYKTKERDEATKKQIDNFQEKIIEPILTDIEEIRTYIKKIDDREHKDLTLIIASYRFRLIQLCKAYIKQGFITPDGVEQLNEFFAVYHGLGGNGQAQEYYELALHLPIHDEDDEK